MSLIQFHGPMVENINSSGKTILSFTRPVEPKNEELDDSKMRKWTVSSWDDVPKPDEIRDGQKNLNDRNDAGLYMNFVVHTGKEEPYEYLMLKYGRPIGDDDMLELYKGNNDSEIPCSYAYFLNRTSPSEIREVLTDPKFKQRNWTDLFCTDNIIHCDADGRNIACNDIRVENWVKRFAHDN